MSEFLRGTVKKATFEIEYPDGSRKVADLPDPENIGLIVLDASAVPQQDAAAFAVSESDWKQNPSMMIYPKGIGARGGGGIPFCTHNGCKPVD